MKKIIDIYINMSKQVKASFWFLICIFLQKSVSIITTPIFTRIMNTEEYGSFVAFNSWLSIISVFVTFNIFAGVFEQGIIKYYDDKNTFYSSLQYLTLSMTIIWTFIYILFKDFWNNIFKLDTTQMLLMIVIIWLSAVFQFWSVLQRTEYEYKKLVIVTLFASIIEPLVSIVLVVKMKNKVTARIIGTALSHVICYLFLFILQIRKNKKTSINKYWSYSLRLSAPLIPHYLSQTMLNSADKIVIKNICGSSSAAKYSLVSLISSTMVIFSSALLQTLTPWIYQKIKARSVNEISKICYFSLMFIAILNILLMIVAPELVLIFAPNDYYEAIYIIPPLSMSVYFMFTYDLFAKFEFYYEKTKYISFATVFCAILNLSLNTILVGKYGYKISGYITLLCYILYSLFHFLIQDNIVKKNFENKKVYQFKIICLISIVFMIFGFIILLLYDHVFIRYILLFIIVIMIIKEKSKLKKIIADFLKIKIVN